MNGTYHYWMNGTQADITESFRFISTPEPFDSAQDKADTVIESERIASAFFSRIAVTAAYHDLHLSHFDVEWQNDNPNAVKFASAHYQFDPNEIIVHRNLDGREFHERLPKPEIFTVLPLLRVFTGKAIREAYQVGSGKRIPVLVPNIKNPSDNVQLLALELDLRSATKSDSETIMIAEKEYQADKFNFIGGNYDQTAKFWVAENDLLLKYEWQQNDMFWEVKLVEYKKPFALSGVTSGSEERSRRADVEILSFDCARQSLAPLRTENIGNNDQLSSRQLQRRLRWAHRIR